MFRPFLISSRRLLVPRQFTVVALPPDSLTSGTTTSIYDVRRNSHVKDGTSVIVPMGKKLQTQPLLVQSTLLTKNVRWASGKKQFKMPDFAQIYCNMVNMIKCVDLNDMKDAPPPAFWVAVGAGSSQLILPFLEVIGGYSPVVTMFQLNIAAVSLGFFGGLKWGLAESDNPAPQASWDTMFWSLVAPGIAVLGLLLPYPLGFLTIIFGTITSLYIHLKSCLFPPWSCALRLFVTLCTVVGLLLALAAYVLFNNQENKNKKKLKAGEENKDELDESEENKEDEE